MISHSRVIFSSAWVILLVLACSFSGCASNQSPATTTPTNLTPATGLNGITIKNFAFSPAILTIKTGTTVTWMNQDGAPPRSLQIRGR